MSLMNGTFPANECGSDGSVIRVVAEVLVA